MLEDYKEELRAEVDDVWAELIRHLPQNGGQPDADREKAEFSAPMRTGERGVERVNFGRGNNSRAGVAAAGGQLRVDRSAYPELILRKGDKVVALDRVGRPIFEVQHVDDRSHLRLICDLGDAN